MRPECLPAILEQLSCELHFDRLVQQLADLIVDRAEAALCRIWIRRSGDCCDFCQVASQCQERGECLHLVGSSGTPESSDSRRCPIGVGPTGLVARAGASLISASPSTDPRFAEEEWIHHHGIQTCAVIPLNWQSRNMGVLGVYCREQLSDEQYQQLAGFVRRASFFLAHAHEADLMRRRMEGMAQQVRALRNEILCGLQVEQLIGTSPAARRLREDMQAAAGSRDPLLILGAPGVGKELAARSVHAQGQKPTEPFFKIDCHHVPATTVESVLFGLETSAFACAEDNPGYLELAHCGTVFLRHLERLPLTVQHKLRDYLHTGRYTRMGGTELHDSTARIIASTTRDLAGLTAAELLDTQLYTLLSQHVLKMPALSERITDIPLLVQHYAERFSREYFKSFEGVDPAVVSRLADYPWPGNDRELSQVVERAVLLSTGPVIAVEPGFGAPMSEDGRNGAVLTLEAVERAHIIHVLQRSAASFRGLRVRPVSWDSPLQRFAAAWPNSASPALSSFKRILTQAIMREAHGFSRQQNGRTPMAQSLRASDLLDRFFLEMRCKVVDLAAALDRIDRAAGSAELVEDERLGQLRDAIAALLELRQDRAERVQMIFSDAYEPNWPHPAKRGEA